MPDFETSIDARVVPEGQAWNGPRLGFQDAFVAARESEIRAYGQSAIEDAFLAEDMAQFEKAKKAGLDYKTMSLSYPDYYSAARFMEGEDATGASFVLEHDKQILDLNARSGLGLKTSKEMWDSVKSRAKQAEQSWAAAETTALGKLGGFAGTMAGAMDPGANPLNAATFMVGGAGKSALTRILSQAGAGGAVEALNQVTGVQAERKLLGLEYGLGQAVSQVAGAAVGAGVLQGAGEAGAKLLGRWFKDAPPPPVEAPRPPPEFTPRKMSPELAAEMAKVSRQVSGLSRFEDARARADLEHVASELERWDGPSPAEIKPRTDTALPSDMADLSPQITGGRDILEGAVARSEQTSLDAMAREYDPGIFRVYDAAARERDVLRSQLEELKGARLAGAAPDANLIAYDIEALKARAQSVGTMKRRDIERRVADLEAQKKQLLDQATASDTPDMAAVRRALVQADERMRDLAPAVSKAYARARGVWSADANTRASVLEMMRDGRGGVTGREVPGILKDNILAKEVRAVVYGDDAYSNPIFAGVDAGTLAPRAGETVSDVALRVLKDQEKVTTAGVDAFRASISRVLGGKEKTLRLDGQNTDLDLDADMVPALVWKDGEFTHAVDADGEVAQVSVRQMLKDLESDNLEIKAVSTCSTRKAS